MICAVIRRGWKEASAFLLFFALFDDVLGPIPDEGGEGNGVTVGVTFATLRPAMLRIS